MRWKQVPEPTSAADAGVPDAVAMHDADGELIGWDESAVEEYYASDARRRYPLITSTTSTIVPDG